MLTVQEIKSMTFEKAVFGGYDQKSVDGFIEQLADDIAQMQKENAALKSKMKVLVDKIEEYRSVEDGMRRALVSAQNIAQDTLKKSKAEAEQLLTVARTEAETRIENYRIQIATESRRLEEARAQNAEFVAQLSAVYEEQLKTLAALSSSEALSAETNSYPTEPISMQNTESVRIKEEKPEAYETQSEMNIDISDEIEQIQEEKTEVQPEASNADYEEHTKPIMPEQKNSKSEEKRHSRFDIKEIPLASSKDKKD